MPVVLIAMFVTINMKKKSIHIERTHGQRVTKLNAKSYFLSHSRRSFLKFSALSFVFISFLAACKKTGKGRILPFFADSGRERPGIKKWYPSACNLCSSHCPVMIKTFENRPIKVEGNKEGVYGGGICATGQTSLVSLYHKDRIKKPTRKKKRTPWAEIDQQIMKQLREIDVQHKEIILLSPAINGAATLSLINEIKSSFKNFRHVLYDPLQNNAILKANKKCFGIEVIPDYLFQKANMVLSFNADFMGSWLNHIDYTQKFTQTSDYDNKRQMSFHVQFESYPSLSGMKADLRIPFKPSEEFRILTYLYNFIAERNNTNAFARIDDIPMGYKLDIIGDQLMNNRGRSILISSSDDFNNQVLVNGINSLLGNIGRTVDLDHPSRYYLSESVNFSTLLPHIQQGKVGALLSLNNDFLGIDPFRNELKAAISKVPLKISLNMTATAFCSVADFVCPLPHYTECWNDYEPKTNCFILAPPVIKPMYDTRPFQESILKWFLQGNNWKTYLKSYWDKNVVSDLSWEEVLKKGIYLKPDHKTQKHQLKSNISSLLRKTKHKIRKSDTEYVFFRHTPLDTNFPGLNPWLAELPDSIAQVSWGVPVLASHEFMHTHRLKNGRFARFTQNGFSAAFPIFEKEGMPDNCLAIPLGKNIPYLPETGNTFDLRAILNKKPFLVNIEKIMKRRKIYPGQDNYSPPEKAPLEYLLSEYTDYILHPEPYSSEKRFISEKRKFKGHHWAMVIDLNKCTGCEACVISCQIENNIPLVGFKESQQRRQMHWLRIDQYKGQHKGTEVFHVMPLLCQQCDNAPCEAVCPVAAISSSSEGLSQQNYQRCIGVRYCAVNCPYSVRRFNYKDYLNDQTLHKFQISPELMGLLLNPDVAVRDKGTMEKCSFCIQRIMEAKARAKKDDKGLIDGEIKTACQQSCPAGAIYFGDLNDKGSEVYALSRSKRAFRLLEHLESAPSVFYLSRLRNDLYERK